MPMIYAATFTAVERNNFLIKIKCDSCLILARNIDRWCQFSECQLDPLHDAVLRSTTSLRSEQN